MYSDRTTRARRRQRFQQLRALLSLLPVIVVIIIISVRAASVPDAEADAINTCRRWRDDRRHRKPVSYRRCWPSIEPKPLSLGPVRPSDR